MKDGVRKKSGLDMPKTNNISITVILSLAFSHKFSNTRIQGLSVRPAASQGRFDLFYVHVSQF